MWHVCEHGLKGGQVGLARGNGGQFTVQASEIMVNFGPHCGSY